MRAARWAGVYEAGATAGGDGAGAARASGAPALVTEPAAGAVA